MTCPASEWAYSPMVVINLRLLRMVYDSEVDKYKELVNAVRKPLKTEVVDSP